MLTFVLTLIVMFLNVCSSANNAKIENRIYFLFDNYYFIVINVVLYYFQVFVQLLKVESTTRKITT